MEDLDLDGLVVIGGDDSNTNAAILAEFFQANGCKTKVVVVTRGVWFGLFRPETDRTLSPSPEDRVLALPRKK